MKWTGREILIWFLINLFQASVNVSKFISDWFCQTLALQLSSLMLQNTGKHYLWRRSLLFRSQSIELQNKSMDWFLYNGDLRHKRIKINRNIDTKWVNAISEKTAQLTICFFKVSDRNNRTNGETCSNLATKTPKLFSTGFLMISEREKKMTLFQCFYW